jgi:hypothetical protein
MGRIELIRAAEAARDESPGEPPPDQAPAAAGNDEESQRSSSRTVSGPKKYA